MSRVEDALRETMRARDAEAPTAAEFRFHRPAISASRRFGWVPAVAVAASVAIVIGIVVAVVPESPPRHTTAPPTAAVLDCPTMLPTSTSGAHYPLPPTRADTLDDAVRLVPTATPAHAVVCAYLHGEDGRLTGSHVVHSGLATLADTLSWLPPLNGGYPPCAANIAPTDADDYLLGLSYSSGTMWVSAPGNHCLGSSNGRFTTYAHVATDASAAYRTGRWPFPPEIHAAGCAVGAGRLGQEHVLVPGTPDSVVVCRNFLAGSAAPNAVPLSRTGTQAELRTLVTALNALPTEPDTHLHHCGLTDSVGPVTVFEVVFAYRVGPPVAVTIAQDCFPPVHNGSLQALHADPTVMFNLMQILAG